MYRPGAPTSGFEKPSGVYPYADHGATLSSPALTLVPMSAALTRREREIAADVAEGLANKHIARRRGLSVHTVENHLRSIFRKVNATSRRELTRQIVGDAATT